MTKLAKIIAWVLLPLMCLSAGIGFAAVADHLSLRGDVSADAREYKGVYISAVSVHSTTNAQSLDVSIKRPTNLTVKADPTSSGGSITYLVTVHNNTDVTCWYLGTDYLAEYGSNSLIGQSGGITVLTKDKYTLP